MTPSTKLAQFTQDYDPHDIGLREVWETLIATGRRLGEVAISVDVDPQ